MTTKLLTLSYVLWGTGLASLVGVGVSFVIMELNRTSAPTPRVSPDPFRPYRAEYLSAHGLTARAWCMRIFIAFVMSFLGGLVAVLLQQ